jgi:hypothetical protein
MFCKICENFMDITNNVSIPNVNPIEDILNVVGGGKNEDISSDYDVSSDVNSKKKKGVVLTEEDIVNILTGKDLGFELDNFNLNELGKIPYFNKLNSNQKTLVINRLYEKIPKNQKIPKNTEITGGKDSYFYCKNCGYNEKIPEKMFIFSRTNESSNEESYSTKFINYKYDNTLPSTKKYNCINKDCLTHKEPSTKKAVFYRYAGTYAIRYICTICNYYWNTITEN